MLDGGIIPDLVECIDTNSLRVYAPTPVLFLCGGPLNVSAPAPVSLREAFTRVSSRDKLKKYNVLIAEHLSAFYPFGHYSNVLKFEADFAQIVDVTVLFSESYGSVAELGAFCMMDEISKRLLLVMDDKNYKDNSFVKLGPARLLESEYGDGSVCVLDRSDIGIVNINDLSGINLDVFFSRISKAILAKSRPDRTTFDRNRVGHLVKLMVGLIQHYGALLVDEISVFLLHIGIKITDDRIVDLLLCAELAGWIKKEKRTATYYCSSSEREAISYKFIAGIGVIDRVRWKADVIDHWRKNDEERFSSIQRVIRGY